MENGSPGCCNGTNATCCGVFNECCANGYLCDPVVNDCVQQSPSYVCQGCQQTVQYIVSTGCAAGCDALPPPADAICEVLVDLGLCEKIISWATNGMSEEAICA